MIDGLLRIKKAMLGVIKTQAISNSCFYDQTKQGIPVSRADGVKYSVSYNDKVDTKGYSRTRYNRKSRYNKRRGANNEY